MTHAHAEREANVNSARSSDCVLRPNRVCLLLEKRLTSAIGRNYTVDVPLNQNNM